MASVRPHPPVGSVAGEAERKCEREGERREQGRERERERAEQLCADVGPVGWSREGERVEQRKSPATVEKESEQAKRWREAEVREGAWPAAAGSDGEEAEGEGDSRGAR